jgi:hypothetical protein
MLVQNIKINDRLRWGNVGRLLSQCVRLFIAFAELWRLTVVGFHFHGVSVSFKPGYSCLLY